MGENREIPDEWHPIEVVSRRLGLTKDVLRVWERRYGAVHPRRSAGNRRLYSEQDVERLLLLRRLSLGGRSIGLVARLPIEKLRTLAESDEAAGGIRRPRPGRPEGRRPGEAAERRDRSATAGAASHLDSCLEAARRLDVGALDEALSRASVLIGRNAVLAQVVTPLMEVIGREWREGTLRIAHEHLVTGVVRTFLGNLVRTYPAIKSAPVLLVATPTGFAHEIGALLAAATAASEGWNVAYLGPDLPAEDIAAAAERIRARAIALSLVHPGDDPHLPAALERIRRHVPSDVPLLVGGAAAAAYADALRDVSAAVLTDMPSFRKALERIRLRPRDGSGH